MRWLNKTGKSSADSSSSLATIFSARWSVSGAANVGTETARRGMPTQQSVWCWRGLCRG
ncbi:hypothetical protein KCP76_07765 [Salmonella enterica subsp. enterica serovar Weltevreden]|nr:hypothetical protein KCP76_07765 [Salmonella enterica subsp. enterica serovar Weltevreden]